MDNLFVKFLKLPKNEQVDVLQLLRLAFEEMENYEQCAIVRDMINQYTAPEYNMDSTPGSVLKMKIATYVKNNVLVMEEFLNRNQHLLDDENPIEY